MAYDGLQALIGTAVIDTDFRKALLNGSRRGAVSNFKLSGEELDAVMSIRADTLEQFAGQLDQWIMKQQNHLEPPPLDLPIRSHVNHEDSKANRDPARLHDRTGAPAIVSWNL
jgi:hypothetical protein